MLFMEKYLNNTEQETENIYIFSQTHISDFETVNIPFDTFCLKIVFSTM